MIDYFQYPIVFIDDDCIFCNFWGNFITKNDKSNSIHISTSSSQLFIKLDNNNLPNVEETIIFYYKEKYYSKSDAVLKIASVMKGWCLILIIGHVVPKLIRDKIYDFIAKRRKSIMNDKCVIDELRSREKFIA